MLTDAGAGSTRKLAGSKTATGCRIWGGKIVLTNQIYISLRVSLLLMKVRTRLIFQMEKIGWNHEIKVIELVNTRNHVERTKLHHLMRWLVEDNLDDTQKGRQDKETHTLNASSF